MGEAPDPSEAGPERGVAASPWRRSIVSKLTLFVGIVVAFTAATLITAGYHYMGGILRDQIDARLSAIADDRQGMLLLALKQQQERVRLIATRTRLRNLLTLLAEERIAPDRFRTDASQVLSDARESADDLLALWVEDDSGRRLAESGPDRLIETFDAAEDTPIRGGEAVDMVCLPRPTGESMAAVLGTAVHSRSLRPVGRLMVLIDFKDIVTQMSDPQWLGETGEMVVGVPQGEVVRFVFPARFRPHELVFSRDRTPALVRALAGEFGFMTARDRFGHEILAAYRPVGYRDWGLLAKMDVEEAYAPVSRLRRILMALGASILALGLGASYVIARQFARPIRRLAATAEAVASGDLRARNDVRPGDEIGTLGLAFNRMTEQLERSHADLERRISDRTRDLEAVRDLLDAFFRISTSRLDHDNIDRTFDSVLRFCSQLGYDLALISLVDREAGVIRAVRGAGTMSEVVGLTVRPLDGDDVLAVVVRDGKTMVITDSANDPRCDQRAVAVSGIHGQLILPLIGDGVLGTLQVATREVLDPRKIDLRPLETLASHTARALAGLAQVEEIRRLNLSLAEHADELSRSEAALREQTQILQLVLDCMVEGVVVADREGKYLVFNPAARQILGLNPLEGLSDDPGDSSRVLLPDRSAVYPAGELPMSRAIRGETIDLVELYVAHGSLLDGRWVVVNARPLRDDHGTIQGGLVVLHDTTRRKQSESRLAVQFAATKVLAEVDTPSEANPRLLQVVGERLDWDFGAIWRVDNSQDQLRCIACWPAAPQPFARFESRSRVTALRAGVGLPGRVWATGAAAWIAAIPAGLDDPRDPMAAEEGLRSGFAVPIMARGNCLGVLEFYGRESRAQDDDLIAMMNNLGSQIGQFIERNRMHARVVQSEKLASLGMLSAGIAHEINNPLAYVANNVAVLERDVRSVGEVLDLYERGRDVLEAARPDLYAEVVRHSEACDLPYIRENLEKIMTSTRQGVKRVADIVHNLRGFARLDRAALDQIDLHDAINAAFELIRGRLQRRRIEVEQMPGEIPPISASPVQINQVFLNLMVNAMQAIEATHREDGKITIRTLAGDGEVVVEIADNGCGIPADILPRIFDPFFTTKGIGDGTGLGLSITHGIVQDHGGRLEVESTQGIGSCFRVILPLSRR